MRYKKGVTLFGVSAEILAALVVADSVWKRLGEELVVTSITDGKHKFGSLHYLGYAGDVRTRYFQDGGVEAADQLRDALTDEYDVVLESTHIHIEFQPKG